MITPETDFATFTYFLKNPGDVGDQFSQFTKEATQLIMNILSTDLLPETIADNTIQFINDDIPNSVKAVLNLTDFSNDLKENLIEYISNVLLLIIWSMSKYNKILFSLLFDIFDKSQPFYQQETRTQYRCTYYLDEETYNTIFENFQVFGGKTAINNSIKFENPDNPDQQISLSILQMIEWFQLYFKFEKITKDYEIQSSIDIFAKFLDSHKNDFTKFNDFEMIKSCFNELRDYLYQLPQEQNDVDYHISKLFDFAYWCLEDSEASLSSRRYSVAIEFFNGILHTFHLCSTDCFFIFAHEKNLIKKILSKSTKSTHLSEISYIASVFAEKEDASLIDSSDILDIYNTSIISGNFSLIKDQLLRLLMSCKINIVDDLADKLIKSYSDESIEVLETIICRTKTNRRNEIIDYFFANLKESVVKDYLKIISDYFLDDDLKQLFIDKYFDLYLNNPQNEDLSNIFSIMIKLCDGDIVHKMISLIDLNRKTILAELKKYIHTSDFLFTKEDLLKLSKIVDDDLYDFLHYLIKKFKFSLINQDAVTIIDQLAHGSLNPSLNEEDIKNDKKFNISEKQLTAPFVQFLGTYLKKKQKENPSENVILFNGYKEIFNLILIAKDDEIIKLLMGIFIKLSDQTKSDYDSIQAFSSLIKESMGIKTNDKDDESKNNEESKTENIEENKVDNENENKNNEDNKVDNDNENNEDDENKNDIVNKVDDDNKNQTEKNVNSDDNGININNVNSDLLKINVDDDKYCKIVKLIKEYIESNEKQCFSDLYNFNNTERHEQSNKTVTLSISGCGINGDFIFPDYITVNGVHNFISNYFEPDSDFSLYSSDNYYGTRNYSYRLLQSNKLEIFSNSEIKLKEKIPIPLSIKLNEFHFQQILYKQLNSQNKNIQKVSIDLLRLLPDDSSISILNKEESSYIRKNYDNVFDFEFQNGEEFNVTNIINRLNNTQFSQLQLEYQFETLKKYVELSKSFKKQLRKNGIIDVLFKYLDMNSTDELIIDLITEIKLKQMNENILHSLFTAFEASITNTGNKYTINNLIKKSIENDEKEFTKAFNSEKNINYAEHLLSLNDNTFYNLIKKSILPSLTDLNPLFNMLMRNLDKIYENTNYKKILLKIIPQVREGIDYNSIIQNQILPEQRKYPNSSITIELISAFKPTENLSSIIDSIDKLLLETSDEKMQKAIFELISSYRSIEMEEKLVPYFAINVDRWNYDPSHEQKSETGFCGLRNLGATCYFNSILQILFFTKPFCKLVLEQQESNIELRKIFSNLTLSNQKSVDTSALTAVWKGWGSKPINPHEQQDALEFFQMFLDKLPSDFHEYFQGKFVNTYKGIDLNEDEMEKFGQFENYEDFFAIQLVIKGFNNLTESFDHFISPDILNEENQLYRESLGRKVDAEKITRIEKAPPFLAIQLKRFEYNCMTHVRDKIMTCYEFDTSIFLNKLMKNYGENEENYFYSLYGIVLHSGTADSGHYTALVKVGDKWFSFNDTDVELYCESEYFDKKISTEFFRNVEQYQPVPYILFYQRIEVPKNVVPPSSQTEETVESNKTNQENNKDKSYGEIALKDLIQYVCEEDKKEIEQSNNYFARVQWLFSHDCFDFILKSTSHKLRLTYLFKILGHSKNMNKFQNKFFKSFTDHNDDGQQIEVFDNNWFLDFLIKNIDELQEIIIHANSIDSFNSFVFEKLKSMPVDSIFPYYNSFALNLTKMTQLWRKVISFTSPMSDFIKISNEAVIKAKENGWIHLSSSFIEDFYINNQSKVPIEGINFSNLFTVIETIIKSENNNDNNNAEDLNIIKSRFNLILQSKDHLDAFNSLIINTFPLIIDSPENFVLVSEDDHQRFNFFEKMVENNKFDDIFNNHMNIALSRNVAINEDEKPDKNDFLIILIQFLIDKVNGEYEEKKGATAIFNYQTRTYETVDVDNHDKEFIQILIDKFDKLILPIVFIYPYCIYAGKLISDMFYDVKPKSEITKSYDLVSNRGSYSSFYDREDGNDDQLTPILVMLMSYARNKINELLTKSAINNENSNKDKENVNENKDNENNNENESNENNNENKDIANNNENKDNENNNENENNENANENKDNANNNENKDNENNNENANENKDIVKNSNSTLILKTFFLLAAWIIKRNNLYDQHFLTELMEIKDLTKSILTDKEKIILYKLLLKFPYDLTNGQHILSILSDIGYIKDDYNDTNENDLDTEADDEEDTDSDLNKCNKKIFIFILNSTESLFTEDQIASIFGSGWFIKWLSKAWYNTASGYQATNRAPITKIVSVIAQKCKPSLDLIIDFLNKVDERYPITILSNLYIEKSYNLLPFETINNLINFTLYTFSDRRAEAGPLKKSKFIMLINKLFKRIEDLENEENERRRIENNNEIVHYLFTIKIKNMKTRINSVINTLSKVTYSRHIIEFIELLIPRLNDDDKKVFIAQICNHHDAESLQILANLGEFSQLINIILNNVESLNDDYEDLFIMIADAAFNKEMKNLKLEPINFHAKQKIIETENENQTETNQNVNESNKNEIEFDVNIDDFLVQLFLNIDSIDRRVIVPLIEKRHIDSIDQDISLLKNTDDIVNSLVERCNNNQLKPTIKLILTFIENVPQTQKLFMNKLEDKKIKIKNEYKAGYEKLFVNEDENKKDDENNSNKDDTNNSNKDDDNDNNNDNDDDHFREEDNNDKDNNGENNPFIIW